MWTKELVIQELKKRILCIDFIKVDGTPRTMYCTLAGQFMTSPHKAVLHNLSDETLAVFDVEVRDCRSFRWDSIVEVEKKPFVTKVEKAVEKAWSLSDYQVEASKTANYPHKGTNSGLAYLTIKLNGEAGEFAEHFGKAMRDDGMRLHTGTTNRTTDLITNSRRELLLKELGDVLWYVTMAATELNSNLEEVAKMNIKKLNDRTLKGTITGSGDWR